MTAFPWWRCVLLLLSIPFLLRIIQNTDDNGRGIPKITAKYSRQSIAVQSSLHPLQRKLLAAPDSSQYPASLSQNITDLVDVIACKNVTSLISSEAQCKFVQSNRDCDSGSSIPYLYLYYCTFGKFQILGASLLVLWLASLFFALGNTAADYFCPSLEELSELLNLAPTVAGVTLLPLGNGAPDVFASIAAFAGAGEGQVGLNSVLGSGFFVTAVVAGAVHLVVARDRTKDIRVDRASFIRDVLFYLVTLLALLYLFSRDSLPLPLPLAFLSLYILYGFSVAALEIHRTSFASSATTKPPISVPLQPLLDQDEDASWLYRPLLDQEDGSVPAHASLPQWMWTSHVAIYSGKGRGLRDATRPLWGWGEEEESAAVPKREFGVLDWAMAAVILPRRVTIPSRQKEGWSKKYAVASAGTAPVLCYFVLFGWGLDRHSMGLWVALGLGAALAILAFATTDELGPPMAVPLPWVAGGFVMSVVWFYLIANELVSALVAAGVIIGVDSAVLGLTVLAWGNSIGDMVSNLAMAASGKQEGVQIAWSGCYAGPMFNALVGLGASLVIASWQTYPEPYVVPRDPALVVTILFLGLGLLFSLAAMVGNRMRFSKAQGVGMILVYAAFIAIKGLDMAGVLNVMPR